MQKSVSKSLFVSFLQKNRWVLWLFVLVVFGVALIIISGRVGGEVSSVGSEEERIASLVSGIDGAGRAEVVINKKEGEIVSCAILCTGADSTQVVSEVKALISSLYGIGYHRISVIKLSE